MPFTLAHAAAALPIRRGQLVPSALIIGTFAPDCEYFLRLGPAGSYGHTVRGALLLSLPLGLAILCLFQTVVKETAAALLPQALQARLPSHKFEFGGASRFLLILVSLSAGIATHLVWDSFTHRSMWLYWHWPFLQERIGIPGIGLVPVYKVLQQVSTAAGLSLLLVWFYGWYRSRTPHPQVGSSRFNHSQRRVVAGSILAVAGSLALVRGLYGARTPYEGHVLATFAGDAVCTLVAAGWWLLVLLGGWGLLANRVGRTASSADCP